jgi:hypothetical protein
MKRALAVLIVASGLGLAAATRARAQTPVTFYFGASSSDTATGLVPGVTSTIPIRVSYYDYVTKVRLVVHFDPAKLAVLGAQSSPSGGFATIDSTNIGLGTAMIAASGFFYGSDVEALRLVVRLLPSVTDGAYLWTETDSAQVDDYYSVPYGYNWIPARARFGMACHASQVWGDVDGNNQVDSRDALITLSAAVGLPVSGFNLAQGDVDGDGLTNSRDALMMLSFSIGLNAGSSGPLDRVGLAPVDACPGLTPPGETVVFSRNLGGGAGGIFRLDAAGGAPVQLTAALGDQWPRLNHAGTAVVFQCDSAGTPLVCRTDSDGSNRATLLTSNPPGAYSTNGTQPDWSPNGNYIVYNTRAGFGIGRMTSTGDSQVTVYSSGMFGSSVAWSRVGDSLAISNPNHYGLYVFPIGTALPAPLDANFGYTTYAAPIRWSPDGSTLATINFNGGGIVTLPATGGTSLPAVALKGIHAFDWGPQGIIFAMPDHHSVPSLWMLQGGFGGPLVRLTDPGAGPADDQPSFRRNP